MARFIPVGKMSKKARRELTNKSRAVWAISPVTRRPENSKAYDRKKIRRDEGMNAPGFSFCYFLRLFSYGTGLSVLPRM